MHPGAFSINSTYHVADQIHFSNADCTLTLVVLHVVPFHNHIAFSNVEPVLVEAYAGTSTAEGWGGLVLRKFIV